jgi:ABC-type multidrug transport system fused ATPase/permease subunit
MRDLPVPDPGTPDTRTPGRYLWWILRVHTATVLLAMVMGIIWMVSQALMPAAIGRAIDEGVIARDPKALALWAGALFGLGITQAVAGAMRHRAVVFNYLAACFRSVQLVARHAGMLGATLPARLGVGEAVSIGTIDTMRVGNAIDITARASGAVVAIIVVGIVLLSASPTLGLVVLVGVPLLSASVTVLVGPLHRRQQEYRAQSGRLTARAIDIIAGLRILRGIGGEATFAARYREQSQRLRAEGVRVARIDAMLAGAQILLPGLFVALVTWIGARFALAGAIEPGELVSFYGYAAFLVVPMRTLTEAADQITRGHVAARRVVRLLNLTPDVADGGGAPIPPGRLVDPESGVAVEPGRFTAIAAASADDAAVIADRLGRYREGEARIGGVPLSSLPRTTVRRLILVADNEAALFSGRLKDELGAGDVRAALHVANAEDIVAALPEGLYTVVTTGSEFSGGQQQRLRLARALLVDPPILVLVEPTSAVDAHTEARIAERLAVARAGRTTVVCTTSPLVLDWADRVIYVEAGRVAAEGTHLELLRGHPGYAATVTRGEQ